MDRVANCEPDWVKDLVRDFDCEGVPVELIVELGVNDFETLIVGVLLGVGVVDTEAPTESDCVGDWNCVPDEDPLRDDVET